MPRSPGRCPTYDVFLSEWSGRRIDPRSRSRSSSRSRNVGRFGFLTIPPPTNEGRFRSMLGADAQNDGRFGSPTQLKTRIDPRSGSRALPRIAIDGRSASQNNPEIVRDHCSCFYDIERSSNEGLSGSPRRAGTPIDHRLGSLAISGTPIEGRLGSLTPSLEPEDHIPRLLRHIRCSSADRCLATIGQSSTPTSGPLE